MTELPANHDWTAQDADQMRAAVEYLEQRCVSEKPGRSAAVSASATSRAAGRASGESTQEAHADEPPTMTAGRHLEMQGMIIRPRPRTATDRHGALPQRNPLELATLRAFRADRQVIACDVIDGDLLRPLMVRLARQDRGKGHDMSRVVQLHPHGYLIDVGPVRRSKRLQLPRDGSARRDDDDAPHVSGQANTGYPVTGRMDGGTRDSCRNTRLDGDAREARKTTSDNVANQRQSTRDGEQQ